MAELVLTEPSARWLYALKPASWPKLLVPLLLGQAIGVAATGRLSPAALLVGGGFTLFGLCFIVLLNDWGDQRVDALKRHMFAGSCSPKTIPDGILDARRVLRHGLLAGALAAAVASLGGLWLRLPWLGLAGAGSMALFVSYSLPPLRLNYRGGGELLEMLGVGLALPWLNAYVQARAIAPEGLWVLPGFCLLSLASGIASGLADEQSDRLGGKRTVVTCFGNRAARRAVEVLLAAGALAWLGGAWYARGGAGLYVVAPALLLVAIEAAAVRRLSGEARTNAFAAQGAYKRHLHRAIWHGASALAIALLAARLVWGAGA